MNTQPPRQQEKNAHDVWICYGIELLKYPSRVHRVHPGGIIPGSLEQFFVRRFQSINYVCACEIWFHVPASEDHQRFRIGRQNRFDKIIKVGDEIP